MPSYRNDTLSRDSDVAGHTRLTAGQWVRPVANVGYGEVQSIVRGGEGIMSSRDTSRASTYFNSTVEKRLHVSGLTPAIAATDISARLQGFGKVLSLDGVGPLNAVDGAYRWCRHCRGGPESRSERAEWNDVEGREAVDRKGAKLDYARRLTNERKRAAGGADEPRSKRRPLPRGVHAGDISVVTTPKPHSAPEGVAQNRPHTPHLANENAPRASAFPACVSAEPARQKQGAQEAACARRPDAGGRASNLSAHTCLRRSSRRNGRMGRRTRALRLPEDDGPQGSTTPWAAAGEESRLPDWEEEKARGLELAATIFGDDAARLRRHRIGSERRPRRARRHIHIGCHGGAASASNCRPRAAAKSKPLKGLFQPREEEAVFLLIARLGDINLELDLDPAFPLDAPACPGTPAHATSPCSQLPPVLVPTRVNSECRSFVYHNFRWRAGRDVEA
ncbi:hypothetical protein JB92DRAFT_2825617 [Gautieria morchelliformis]|nr:hypothetical protein JB92DRAFT_2825617 [Gautieria morchelliformis]